MDEIHQTKIQATAMFVAVISERLDYSTIGDAPARALADYQARTALTCHLVAPGGHPGGDMLPRVAQELSERFGIGHSTLQPELKEPSAVHTAAMCNR